MSPVRRAALATFFLSLSMAAATASSPAQPKIVSGKTSEEQIATIRKILDETLIETKSFQKEMPLPQFLEALQKHLPPGGRILFRIESQAFGNSFADLAKTPVRLPLRPKRIALRTALRLAIARTDGVTDTGVEYRILTTHVAITTPERALYTVVYDVRDILEQGRFMFPDLLRKGGLFEGQGVDLRDLGPNDGVALLVRLILTEVDPDSRGSRTLVRSLKILNGTKLAAKATVTAHEQIDGLLTALRRLADLAVVMNAGLYEVDRPFYTKQIAPLLADAKQSNGRRLVRVDGALVKKLQEHSLVLKSEPIKIRPGEQATFLSLQIPFRYLAHPGDQKRASSKVYRTGLDGVSFRIRPAVSADRRCIRLKLTEEVAQLVAITPAKILDGSTGQELRVESPNVRKSSVTATLDIEDGQPVLMPVDYRPPAAAGKDRLWVLLAKPTIYIEEEEEQIRKAGLPAIPRGPFKTDEAPKKRAELRKSDEVQQLLQAIVEDVLTNPELKDTRAFYGTPEDKQFALVDGATVAWPEWFEPSAPGYKIHRDGSRRLCFFERRLLGISLHKFSLKEKKAGPENAPIEVVVSNAGGSANGAVIGGCTVSYAPRREGNRWVVEFHGAIDP